jgi:hypothetical protein
MPAVAYRPKLEHFPQRPLARRLIPQRLEFSNMPVNLPVGTAARALVAALAGASIAAAAAYTQLVAESSACRTLEYKDGRVPRAQYVPCAGEMIAALTDLDRQTQAAFAGDGKARAEGQESVRRVIALMKAAGGLKLLDRWDDRALMAFNLDVHNAVTHYQAFYMVGPVKESSQFAETTRAAAKSELDGGTRNYEDARRLYQRLK